MNRKEELIQILKAEYSHNNHDLYEHFDSQFSMVYDRKDYGEKDWFHDKELSKFIYDMIWYVIYHYIYHSDYSYESFRRKTEDLIRVVQLCDNDLTCIDIGYGTGLLDINLAGEALHKAFIVDDTGNKIKYTNIDKLYELIERCLPEESRKIIMYSFIYN